MQIKKLIDSIISGNTLESMNLFEDLINERVSVSVTELKEQVSNNIVNIDEISKEVISAYTIRAYKDYKNSDKAINKSTNDNEIKKHIERKKKRIDGINKAFNKINKDDD